MEPGNQLHPCAYGARRSVCDGLLNILSKNETYELGLYYKTLLDQGRPLNFMTTSFKNTGTRSMLNEVQIPLLNQEANSRLAI